MARVKLVKVWDEFTPVVSYRSGKSQKEYRREVRVPHAWLELKPEEREVALQELVKYYNERYPDRNYEGRWVRVGNKRLFRIIRGDRKSRVRHTEVPVLIDPETGDFYVPGFYVKKKARLVAFTIDYRVSALRDVLMRIGKPIERKKPGRKPSKLEKCPVCGEPGFLTQRWAKKEKYVYYYFGHNTIRNGRHTKKWCYVGKLPIQKEKEGGEE